MHATVELQVLDDLSSCSGSKDKMELLKNNSSDQRLADLLEATFDFNRKFFIKSIPEVGGRIPMPGDKHDMFMRLLNQLETGQFRGHAGEQMVATFLSSCTEQELKWYTRVIKKDLKCGISEKTAVKAGFKNIPIFDVMLAKDGGKCKKLIELVSKGVWVSPKLDGYRCLAVVNNGSVTLLSRKGTEYHNFPNIVQSLKSSFPSGQYVFDGEIMSDDFQAMQKSAFANKRQTTVGDVKYHVFGYIPYDEWKKQKFSMLTKDRLKELNKLSQFFDDKIEMVSQVLVTNIDQVYEWQNRFENLGYEGAMVLPNLPYYTGRKSNALLKFKSMLTQDCVITDLYEGKKDTRLEGKMGGVVVVQENGKICECGSGWSDEDREIMWKDPNKFKGQIIEVKYQELTKDKIMRFPVFMRFRNDKG